MSDRLHPLSRRTFLRGVGVTMALPWLESVAGLGRRQAQEHRRPSRRCGSPACSPATASTARSGGPRAKARTWNSARCWSRSSRVREKLLFLRGLYNAGSPHRRHPQLPDRQPAHRRAPRPRRRDQVRHQLRPGHRRADEGPDEGAEPRAGHASRRSRRSTRTTR